jgi:phage terminase large subunit-like protein
MIQMKRLLSEFHVVGSTKPTTNEIYLEPLRAQAEIGRIKMLRGDWNQDCLRELTSFPKGRHDDQCVAIARAFFQLSDYEGLQIAYVGMLPEQEPAQ